MNTTQNRLDEVKWLISTTKIALRDLKKNPDQPHYEGQMNGLGIVLINLREERDELERKLNDQNQRTV